MVHPSSPVAPETVNQAVRSWFEAVERLQSRAPNVRAEQSAPGTWVLVWGIHLATANGVFSASRRPNIVHMALRADSLSELGLPWCIHVRGEPANELLVVADRHGLTHHSRFPFMVCDRELVKYSADSAVSVRTLSSSESRLYVETMSAGLEVPVDTFGELYGGGVLDTDGVTAYLVEVEGQPVSTGLTIQANGQAGIFNVTTVPAFRGRGYARAVSERMVRDSFAAGASHVFLNADDAALPLYKSIGFETAETWTYLTHPEES